MKTYDQEKMQIVKDWVEKVATKKMNVFSPLGLMKKTYEDAESLGAWEQLKEELAKAERKAYAAKNYKDPESEKIREEINKTISELSDDEYKRLRTIAENRIKDDKDLKFLGKNLNLNKGIGKAILNKQIYKEIKDGL